MIVGNSGCGKTTLVKMILGYFDKNEYDGTISINNMELVKINPQNLYKNIGFVCQNDFLFASTVQENIILGRDDSLENLNDFKLVVGLDSDFLGKNIKDSNDVSLGEKQRIDLSRILTKKYQVYIFDEPTSNLDPGNATRIIDYIVSHKDVIIIVITHDQRPEILQKFDHVININNI